MHKYPTTQARWVILASLLLIYIHNAEPPQPVEPEEIVVPERVEAEIERRQLANKRYAAFRKAQEEAFWAALVEQVAERTGIRDRQLAERVTHAIDDAVYDYGMSPWLLTSLIRVESSGNPNAVSPVGAIGLTQIMPATGEEIALELGVLWAGPDMLRHPETSVRFGAHYLYKLLKRFDGDERAALAAYNWGPTHIAKRLEQNEELPQVYPDKVLSKITQRVKVFFSGMFK